MVIASGLLAFVLAGLVVGFTNARRSSVMASDQMKAMHKARQAIEGLSALNFNDAKLAVGTHVLTDLGTSDLFRMSNSYTVALNTNYPSTKDVTVNVFWTTPGRAKVQSITLSSSFTVGLHND
jgi:type II secretory pathway pseudopilin PulG